MHKATIERIRERIRQGHLGDYEKQQLESLLNQLEQEFNEHSSSGIDKVGITSMIEDGKSEDLRASVQSFNATHPRLVSVVNQISMMLANIGI